MADDIPTLPTAPRPGFALSVPLPAPAAARDPSLSFTPGALPGLSFPEALRTAWDETTIFGAWSAAMRLKRWGDTFAPREGYDPFADPRMRQRPDAALFLADARSPEEFEYRFNQLIKKESRAQQLANSGLTGLSATLLAQFGSAEGLAMLMIPGGGLRGAARQVAAMAPAEIALQGYNPNMTATDAALSLGAAALFGLIGNGAMYRGGRTAAEVDEAAARFVQEFDAVDPPPRVTAPPRKPGGFQAVDPNAVPIDEAGAARTPGTAPRAPEEELEGEALKRTGLGIERLPDTPVKRLLMSVELRAREIAAELADLSGMTQRKNVEGRATAQPVERSIREYVFPLVEAIREQDRLYMAYRGRNAARSDLGMAWDNARLAISDMVNGRSGFLSHAEFRAEIGKALHMGDTHDIPEVAQAAKAYRKMMDFVAERAQAEDLFTLEARQEVARLRAQLEMAAGDAKRIKSLNMKIQNLEKQIETIRTEGIGKPGNAKSYAPLVMRRDKIDANLPLFRGIVRRHLAPRFYAKINAVKDENLRELVKQRVTRELDEATDAMVAKLRNQRPWKPIDEDAAGMARSLHRRDMDIPVELLFDFMELDAEALMRQYARTMGADIELAKRFGSIDMREVIAEVEAAWMARINAGIGNTAELRKAMERDLEDIRALRDRLRGTYGAPDDPYSTSASMIRTAKTLNYITMLGGVFLSSLPDVARPIMTEGFARAFPGFKALISGIPEIKIAVREAELAGEALDIVLGSRAAAFLDIGDVFGRAMPYERGLNTLAGAFSLLNLLNPWTDLMKRWTAVIVQSRIVEESRNWVRGGISQVEMEKLARAGIDKPMAERIARQFDQHGILGPNRLFIANTEAWTDAEAVAAFRSALVADVDRIIVTPGIGDTPLWTSSQLGSLIAQFKKFALASTQRVLISGLHDRDAAFFTGAAALIGMAVIADYLKSTVQYGSDWSRKPWQERLGNAIDRAGIGGWFMEANNIIERLSDNRVGVRPFLGGPQRRTGFESKVGAIAGPTAQQLATLAGVLSDLGSLQYTDRTAHQIRRLIPMQSLFWAQPGFDALENALSP